MTMPKFTLKRDDRCIWRSAAVTAMVMAPTMWAAPSTTIDV